MQIMRLLPVLFIALLTGACSVNPATGQRQFTAFMSPAQEAQIGATEHKKVIREFGQYNNKTLQAYVQEIGQNLARHTERSDVEYKFTLLDTPLPNAFALPGGYVYITRGILTLANDESEMAAVIAHEIGHVTARHSAERYSQSVATSLGLSIADAVIGSEVPGFGQTASLGGELFLKSNSRGQENQADTLGIRYLARAGYDPYAMTRFLENLQRQKNFQALNTGQRQNIPNFLSTHPGTEDRIRLTAQQNQAQYPPNGKYRRGKDIYMNKISGMTYGDGIDQGFVRGNSFIHTKLGFRFDVPAGFVIDNQPTHIVATHKNGSAIFFEAAPVGNTLDPFDFLTQVWGKGSTLKNPERLSINNMPAATANLQNSREDLRLIAIKFSNSTYYRFAFATPRHLTKKMSLPLRETTYSFRPLKKGESKKYNPQKIMSVKVKPGDTISSLSSRMDVPKNQEALFRTINGLGRADHIKAGDTVKLVITP